jgi:hypothetical protein
MSDVRVDFSIQDEFSAKLDEFDKRLRQLEQQTGKATRGVNATDKAMDSLGKAGDRAGGMFKGFAGMMFLANQAMQAFSKLADNLKAALDDVTQKERAVIMLGKEAGDALSSFARDSARTLGRSQSDIMGAALRWRETGIGGEDIMEMTGLADRFANLSGKSYEDVANALNDAVKNKNVGGLAELLGGGEGVERKLQRAGVERKLRSGNVSGAMESFKQVADGFGYTQEKADKMRDTVGRKMERMVTRVKDKFTGLFSDIVRKAEPVIDKVLGWLESEEVDIFFDNIATDIANAIELIGEAATAIGNAFDTASDWVSGTMSDIVGESVSTTETLVGIFVGGFTAIGGYIYNAASKLWDWLLTGAESVCNGIVEVYKRMKGELTAGDVSRIGAQAMRTQGDIALGAAKSYAEAAAKAMSEGNMEAAKRYQDAAEKQLAVAKSFTESSDSLNKAGMEARKAAEYDFTNLRFDMMDVDKRVADNIKGTMDWINGHSVDKRSREDRDREAIRKKLGNIAGDTSKIHGAMMHEQDLRWLKERSEQRFVNNVNVRQLTPTINVRIEGRNVSAQDVERTMRRVLEEQANAGTYNAYGEAV